METCESGVHVTNGPSDGSTQGALQVAWVPWSRCKALGR